MNTGAYVLIVAVVAALAFGLYRALTDGRFAGTHRVRHGRPADGDAGPGAADTVLTDTRWETALGERATLLQFSSAFCAPCRAARRILGEVAEIVPGVVHIEVDAEQHLELVRRLGILRTPTTLILDAEGHETSRASGAPTRDQVLGALAASDQH